MLPVTLDVRDRAAVTDVVGGLPPEFAEIADRPQPHAAVTTGTIDLLGILSASQALSSETSIERLYARVAQVLSAMTGATGVHLLLWDDERQHWLLPAPDSGGTAPVSGTGHEHAVPMSVLRYAQRTREPLVVADATGDDRFARDPYLAGRSGLRPALRALARRSAVPVSLQVQVAGRLPEQVEVSAYYVVAEALTNAAKHGRASAGGTGLAGLKDRVEALGGRIFLHSPRGAGTSLRVQLPLAPPTAA